MVLNDIGSYEMTSRGEMNIKVRLTHFNNNNDN